VLVRVAIVTETFLPQVNGVTNSVARAVEHLTARGAEVLVVAPGQGPLAHAGAPVVRVPAAALPRYPSFALGLPSPRVEALLRGFAPDVVHLASPVLLGASAVAVARRLGVPAVAVYQTDVVRFVARYGLGGAVPGWVLWAWLRRLHNAAARTLAPSSSALWDLRRHGVERVRLWARGVDPAAFSPGHRSAALRARLAPRGEVVVGYVGRLAAEKRVERLAPLARLPGVRLVVVGDGPRRAALERRLPGAAFLGLQRGEELSRVVASLDVFVHPGTDETFCQAAQEALSAGVPVVAPAAGGLLDLVRHGETGLLIAPERPRELVAAVRALAADPSRRAALGRAARASVAARTWTVVGDQLLGHYRAVLNGARAEEAVA
jgi:phosphatidylinositol alpha 1,6-mannosyltransferase